MTTRRQKEIESLRNRLANLEAQQEQELKHFEVLETAHAALLSTLDEAGISFESYVRTFVKDIRRVFTKIEREQAKTTPKRRPAASRKTSVAKKGRRRRKAIVKIKIPAGSYGHVPADPDRIFQVKEKGPRPKLLKAYAEEVGLEAFLNQCRLD